MEFAHTHGLGGMLNITTHHTIDVIRHHGPEEHFDQGAVAERISVRHRKKSDLEKLRHYADEDGYLALLDTYLPYLIVNPQSDYSGGKDVDIPNNRLLGYTDWQGVQTASECPVPAYHGSKPSPLATNLIFRWCDGIRSNLVEALKRNEDFQRRGVLGYDITCRSLAFKDRVLGNGIWKLYMDLWYRNQADVVRTFEVTGSVDDLGEADSDDEENTYDSHDYDFMNPKSLWPYENPDVNIMPRLCDRPTDPHYKSIAQIKHEKASWPTRRVATAQCDDPRNFKLFRRYVKLNPDSA